MDENQPACSFCGKPTQPLIEGRGGVFLCQRCEAYTHQIAGTEFASGRIMMPKPKGSAFICEVLLDDGRLIEAMVPMDQYLPGHQPTVGDCVYVLVERSGISLVLELTRATSSPT